MLQRRAVVARLQEEPLREFERVEIAEAERGEAGEDERRPAGEGLEGRRGVRERRYWQAVKRRALERPVVEGEAGSRIHHWAQTVSPGTMPAEA
jgi:hypothetical protein